MKGIVLSANAPAKINLFLELHSKRDDGYHELETVMAAIALRDHLVVCESHDDQIHLQVSYAASSSSQVEAIPTDHRNLAFQAADLLRRESGTEQGIQIHLNKMIPSEAGLGGASADAAIVLKLANQFWGINWPDARLAKIAGEIGSDVPFFLYSSPAVCRGRGEIVEPLGSSQAPWLVVIKPPVGFSTPKVYSHAEIPARRRSAKECCSALAGNSISRLAANLFNRLEEAAAKTSDWVHRLRSEFDRIGCAGHQLSGSGSSYFGLFPNHLTARRAARVLSARVSSADIYCSRLLCLQKLAMN